MDLYQVTGRGLGGEKVSQLSPSQSPYEERDRRPAHAVALCKLLLCRAVLLRPLLPDRGDLAAFELRAARFPAKPRTSLALGLLRGQVVRVHARSLSAPSVHSVSGLQLAEVRFSVGVDGLVAVATARVPVGIESTLPQPAPSVLVRVPSRESSEVRVKWNVRHGTLSGAGSVDWIQVRSAAPTNYSQRGTSSRGPVARCGSRGHGAAWCSHRSLLRGHERGRGRRSPACVPVWSAPGDGYWRQGNGLWASVGRFPVRRYGETGVVTARAGALIMAQPCAIRLRASLGRHLLLHVA